MHPLERKERFGKDLVFHGSIDVQGLLPFGTPVEVEQEVNRRIGILGEDGGYIVAHAYAIQADTPVENIMSLYDSWRQPPWRSVATPRG